MNYNDKKNENLEFDDMKIKSHLDASLDLSGISVSEDLINRTLDAIKKQAAEQETEVGKTSSKEDSKKVIPWNRYIRTFAGVAAAAIVVVAGYGFINSGLSGKMSKSTEDSATTDMAYDTTATQETALSAADSTASTSQETTEATDEISNADAFMVQDSPSEEEAAEAPLFSIMADVSDTDTGAGENGSTGETIVGATTAKLKGTEREGVLTFRDIFLADPAQAEYITITDEVNQTAITLTDQEEILDFYTVMDQQQFTFAAESTTETDYTIEMSSAPDAALYTMTVGNQVTVVYTGGEVVSQSLYDVADLEALKQSLKDFYQKYSQ